MCKYSHVQLYVFPQQRDVHLNMYVYEAPVRFYLPINP